MNGISSDLTLDGSDETDEGLPGAGSSFGVSTAGGISCSDELELKYTDYLAVGFTRKRDRNDFFLNFYVNESPTLLKI